MLWGLWVSPVESGYKSFHTFGILRWPPFIIFNPISLQMYKIFMFPSEDVAV